MEQSDPENIDLIRRSFGPNAAAYATSGSHARGWSLPRLLELVPPKASWQMLDIATGAGHTALTFAPHVDRVIASDLTPEMLATAGRLARERGLQNLEFRQANAQDLPFEAATFDLVTCRIAPHHFPDPAKFVAEAARVLRPMGIFGLVDNIVPEDEQVAEYINAFERFRDASHVRCLPLSEWIDLIKRAGLTLTHSEIGFKTMDFAVWADNQDLPPAARAALRDMLSQAPAAARQFLRPRPPQRAQRFQLAEGILIAQKGYNTAGRTW